MKAYESRDAAATEARRQLGDDLFQKFWIARHARLSEAESADAERVVTPLARQAAKLLAEARELAEAIRADAPASRHRRGALEHARDACTHLEFTASLLETLAADGPAAGWVPLVAVKPDRRKFIRIALDHFPEARDAAPRAWAYFAIGTGIEDVVRAEPRRDGRSAKEMFRVRCNNWRTDLAAVLADSQRSGVRSRSRPRAALS